MNLEKLFEMQRELDQRIIKEKGLEGQDLLPQKILALQVELGELANEWRGFKFWSEDREPRTEVKRHVDIPGYKAKGVEIRNPLLEEYVDCLHFILSIGLELARKYEQESIILSSIEKQKQAFDVIRQFHEFFMNTTSLYISTVDEYYDIEDMTGIFQELFGSFVLLGELLGFTWEQIEQAYLEKNKVNHGRQATGY